MTIPQFIVLGGHKCGTSSLHYYLDQHPEIYMPPIKGVDFFNREGNSGALTTFEEYQQLYSGITTEKVAGEVSSVYLYSERACNTIKRYRPDAKLIAILRNPVNRALSNFNMLREQKKENKDIREIFSLNHVLKKGLYSDALRMYFDQFNREQLHVLLFDSLQKDQDKFFHAFFELIGVTPTFRPETSIILRKGGEIKQKQIKKLFEDENSLRSLVGLMVKPFTTPEQRLYLYRFFKNKVTQKNELPQEVRERLIDFYRDDILKVQDLLEMDLSHWLKPEAKK